MQKGGLRRQMNPFDRGSASVGRDGWFRRKGSVLSGERVDDLES